MDALLDDASVPAQKPPVLLVAGPGGCSYSAVRVPGGKVPSDGRVIGRFLRALRGRADAEPPRAQGEPPQTRAVLLLPSEPGAAGRNPRCDCAILTASSSPEGWVCGGSSSLWAVGTSAARVRLELGAASCRRLDMPRTPAEAGRLLEELVLTEESRLALAARADGLAEERRGLVERVESASEGLEAFMEAQRKLRRAFVVSDGPAAGAEALRMVGGPLAETASRMDTLIAVCAKRTADSAAALLDGAEDQEALYRFATLELSRDCRTQLSALLESVRELLGGLERSATDSLEGARRHYGKLSRALGEGAGGPPVEDAIPPGSVARSMPEVEVTVPRELLVRLRNAARRDPATSLRQRREACRGLLFDYRGLVSARVQRLREGFVEAAGRLRRDAAGYLEGLSEGAERALADAAQRTREEAGRLEELVRKGDAGAAEIDDLLSRARAAMLASGARDPGPDSG